MPGNNARRATLHDALTVPGGVKKFILGRARQASLTGIDKRGVLVLGGTGLVGGAVVRGLLTYPWFRVLVATRRPWCAEALLLKQAGECLFKRLVLLLPGESPRAHVHVVGMLRVMNLT